MLKQRRQWQPTPALLPGKSHGRRSLVGCSPWDHEESDTYWATSLSLFTFMHWRRKWQPTPVFLPGGSQGRGSLVGCRLWGRTESDTTERLHFQFSLSWIGEVNGNPLQCSCLEDPWDRRAWWAAIYGVAQSRTRLKWLSSSSSSIYAESFILSSSLINPICLQPWVSACSWILFFGSADKNSDSRFSVTLE